MPEVTHAYKPGTPCWVDLMVKDQQAALDFYRDLFGWQGEVGPAEFGGYAVCTLNGRPVAGIMAATAQEGQPEPPSVWSTYLASADADATSRAITDNGGSVMFPVSDVGTTGRMMVATDPSGAVFGVWQPLDFFGAQVVNEPGALTWNELNTTDPEAAGRFYEQAFGLRPATVQGLPGYYSLNVGERTVGGMQPVADYLPAGTPSHWMTYFSVDDCDSVVDALVKAGGSVIQPPFDMQAGRMSVVADPQGAVFAVIASPDSL
ncbi:putative glyoxylase CFP32 [Kitasatospora herbaricolor]|uniref:VOC family protein n=1 Tax=Kitasatospora herbaricolor TaxID=68217 RepID=UPI0017483D5E|nr:VOC family protein [Kitasatospora herbaricolor]MDQ0309930.1 putative enzyme related to lactoylglutathione lyase [Kitasatospora herbaricolor]GGV32607.1 putative glyoxylase CFP32 [Kitasatospora herbaricolor]